MIYRKHFPSLKTCQSSLLSWRFFENVLIKTKMLGRVGSLRGKAPTEQTYWTNHQCSYINSFKLVCSQVMKLSCSHISCCPDERPCWDTGCSLLTARHPSNTLILGLSKLKDLSLSPCLLVELTVSLSTCLYQLIFSHRCISQKTSPWGTFSKKCSKVMQFAGILHSTHFGDTMQ